MKSRHILPALAIVAATASAQPEVVTPPATLGRLFFTPEARAQLDRQRQFNPQEAHAQETGTLRLDGVVIRSTGNTTVWVNQQDARETGIVTRTSPRTPGQATLVTGNEAPADIKVGVTLDRATRDTSGGLASGEIRVQRPRPQP